jgi:hypothetical protein
MGIVFDLHENSPYKDMTSAEIAKRIYTLSKFSERAAHRLRVELHYRVAMGQQRRAETPEAS